MTPRRPLAFASLLSLVSLLSLIGACKAGPASDPPPLLLDDSNRPDPIAEILAVSDLPPTLDQPLADDPMGVTIHRLSNGLTVYLSTDRQAPRISTWIAVRTGSRNDPADSTGLAHYLEHMLFKGTDELGTTDFAAEQPQLERIAKLYTQLRTTTDPGQRKLIFAELDAANQAIARVAVPNEIDRLYTTLGVQGLNAFTSTDMTVYIADLPSNRLEAWAALEAERFADPSFRLFTTELEAVYEEKNLSLDDPEDRAWDALAYQLFPHHPYGTQTTIGSIEHLKNPAYQDMIDYFERWYVPNNMALMLAGDIDAETALPILERAFGAWTPKSLDTPADASLTPISGRVASEVVGEGEQAVTIAWASVPFAHPDEPVLTVMHWLLDNNTSGLLNVELELSQKVADASAFADNMLEAGMFVTRATARDGQALEQVEQLLLDVVGKLEAGEFTQQDIDAIVLANDISRKRQAERNGGRTSKMMESFIYRLPWSAMIERDERLRSVTREQVMQAARTYLGPNFSVVYRRAGKPELSAIDKPSITPLELDPSRESAFGARIAAMKPAEIEPAWLSEGSDFQRASLPAGPMIAVLNQRNDLFSINYRFDRGHQRDRMLCFALDLLQQSGAGDQSAEAFNKQLFALGGSIEVRCSASTSSIVVSGIDANMEATLALLDRWFRQVKLEPETLRKLGENLLGTRKDTMADPDQLAYAIQQYAAFDRESRFRLEPSNKQITQAKIGALAKLIQGFLDHTHETLYFGPRTSAEAAKVIGIGREHAKLERRPAQRYRKTAATTPVLYFVHREVAKASVSVLMPLGVGERERKPVAELLDIYLGGGMNALLFQELREARGLVYYAFGRTVTGEYPDDDWAMSGAMGTQMDKTPDAIATYLELVRTRPLDADRIAVARATLDQDYRSSRIDPRWSAFWISAWDDAGEPSDPRPWTWQQIQALDDQQLRAYASSFAEAPVIITIVGDRSRDMAALEKIGKVIELEPAALFSYGAFAK